MSARVDDLMLGHLRWSWGSAYVITLTGDKWTAERRDKRGGVLIAHDPDELHDLILADYVANPVPR